MTIYRTWADMPTLLGDLMTREWAGVVTAQVGGQRQRDLARSGWSTGIVGTVRTLRDNELFVRIVELDPELILPYLFSRRGRSQDLILALTVEAIEAGQADGVDPRRRPRRDGARRAAGRPRLRAVGAHDGRRRRRARTTSTPS